MKKIIFTLWIMGCIILSHAQKPEPVTPYPVSIDSITKLITYQGVAEVSGVNKEELYLRINEWFHTSYKNPAEVIRENDSLKFIITGKPRFRLLSPPNKEGVKIGGNNLAQYTITVAARDGRFKYELTNFNWIQPSYYASERWLDTNAKSYLPVFNDYLQQLDAQAQKEIKSLKDAVMKAKSVKDKDKW